MNSSRTSFFFILHNECFVVGGVKIGRVQRGFKMIILVCFCFLHLAEETNVSYQQQGASHTSNQTACATKHAAVAAARGQDLSTRGRLKHKIR